MQLTTVAERASGEDGTLEALREAASEFVALGRIGPSADLQEAVSRSLDALCRAIEACEDAGFDRREILALLGHARAVHGSSPFIARAQVWPRGYAGDYETVEYLCDAVNQAVPGTVGHALEEAALGSPITAQHRNKVAFQADAILAACRQRPFGARILSIGCGGCRDLRSILGQLTDSRAEFVLCDFDYEALDFALHALGPLAARCTYLNATVPRVFRRLVPYGPFDLVIVGGVCDYLPDRWVTLTARSVWDTLLAPEGQMILTNIKRGNPFRVWLEYLANWELIERDERDLVRCCQAAGIPEPALTIRPDETGLALLLTAARG